MRVIKFLFFILVILILSLGKVDKYYAQAKDLIRLDYNELSDRIIRFHFIANSDLDFDQYVKNTVKDNVLSHLENKIKLDGNNLSNMKVLYNSIDDIKNIALDVLEDFGISQEVSIDIGEKYFEDRVYGSYVIPEGVYDYFIVNIGQASGRNFWSLLFSGVGFVQSDDEKLNVIPSIIKNNKSKSREVYKSNDKSKESDVKISFKIVEVVKGIFKKII